MTDWLTAARLVDAALACVALEAIALWIARHRWTTLARAGGVAANLVAGAALLLAVRIAVGGGHWSAIALCLIASLAAHVCDLGLRFKPVDEQRNRR